MMYSQQEYDMVRRQTMQIEAEKRALLRWVLIVVSLLLAGSVILTGWMFRQYSDSEDQIRNANDRKASAENELRQVTRERDELKAIQQKMAAAVAQRLGWSLVDNQLIDEVAARAGLPPEEVAERDERAPNYIERLARTLASAMPEFVAPEGGTLPDTTEERLVKITERVVADLAEQGRVVLVGRAALAVLATFPNALHVKIVAPIPHRVARLVERDGIDLKQAEKLIAEVDGNRGRYHKQYYRRDWDDASNYDLVLNTGRLGIDGAVDVILGRVRAMSI